MLAKKKKLTRKEIKEDKLVTTYYKSIQFFNDNKSKIYTYGLALLVVIAGVYFYSTWKGGKNDEASAALAKVMEIYESGAYQEAIDGRKTANIMGLKQIVDEYGSTESGEAAKIFLANSYNYLGKLDEANKYYDDYSGDIDIFKAAALAGKAGYYEYKNEYEKAAEKFEEASHVTKENALNAEYLLKASINYISANEKEKAKELLTKIKDDYKTSTTVREVEKYMALVN